MPSVATGVRTIISSGLFAAISPETNTNTPWTTEKLDEPSSDVGSKISSSNTMRPSSPSENSVSSMKTIATAAPAPVSRTSPWKTGESLDSVTVTPSTLLAVTVPTISSTRPIGCGSTPPSVWAYCPGATGPASSATRSGGIMAPPSVINTGGSARVK